MQYRMNRDIQLLANTLVYSHALRCGNEAVATASLHVPQLAGMLSPAWPQWLLDTLQPARKVVFLNTDTLPMFGLENNKRTPDGQRMCNTLEAAIVGSVVRGALAAGCAADSIGIMSPYRAQLRLLRLLLTDAPDVEVRCFSGPISTCSVALTTSVACPLAPGGDDRQVPRSRQGLDRDLACSVEPGGRGTGSTLPTVPCCPDAHHDARVVVCRWGGCLRIFSA